MQWATMTSKAVMGPQFLWEAETEEEKNTHKDDLGGGKQAGQISGGKTKSQ